MNTIAQLIEDTLHERQITSRPGSCFVSNEAGLQLLECESNICSEIENRLLEIDDALRGSSATIGQFAGLDHVIGGYLVNAARYDSKRAITFMQRLCPALLREFIANVPVFFRKPGSDQNFAVALPDEYVEFAKTQAEWDDSAIAETAQRVVSRMSPQ